MVVAMKLISIGFDHEHDSKDVFGFYGYLLNPASVIFGPFISYEDYLQLLHGNPLVRIFNTFKFLLTSVIFETEVIVVPYTLICRGLPVREDTSPEPLVCEVGWPAPFLTTFISPVLPLDTHLLLGEQ